jgi:hypothetical protein
MQGLAFFLLASAGRGRIGAQNQISIANRINEVGVFFNFLMLY